MNSGVPGGGGPTIVFLAPNWLGDVVMSMPLLNLLRSATFGSAAAQARLVLAVRGRWAPLFAADPRLDGLLPVARTGRHAGGRGLLRLASDLRRQGAQGIVLGPPSFRAGAASWLARIPVRVGFRTDGRGIFLNAGLDFPGRGVGHYSRQLLALGHEVVSKLGGKAGPPTVTQASPLLPGLVPEMPAGLDQGPPVWAMGVGTTYGQAKDWPLPRVLEFVSAVVDQEGVRVVLLGQGDPFSVPAESGAGSLPRVRRELAGGPGVVDLIGRTSLQTAAGILSGARIFVGNDSGLMHLAAALGTPTVGIFGSSDPGWTAPLGALTAVVAPEGFACSPCFRPTCNQERFCLDALPADRVLGVARSVLAAKGAPAGEGVP